MTTNPAQDYAAAFGPPPQPDPPLIGGTPQPPTPTAPPPPRDDAPTFGRRDGGPVKRISFNLVAYRGDEEVVERLTVRADVDLSSVMGLGGGNANLGRQIATMLGLLRRTVVDDDGVSVHAKATAVVPRPGADDSDDLIAVDDLPEGADYAMSDIEWLTPEVRDREGNVLVEEQVHDTAADAGRHMRERGSSLRRFAAVMDDDALWIEQSALEEIIDYLMTQAADRPTKRSSARSRSRPRQGR